MFRKGQKLIMTNASDAWNGLPSEGINPKYQMLLGNFFTFIRYRGNMACVMNINTGDIEVCFDWRFSPGGNQD